MRAQGIVVVMVVASNAAAQPNSGQPAATAAEPEVEVPPKPTAPPIDISYDNGLTFEERDGKYGLQIAFRTQVRFETTRAFEEDSQFLSHFIIPRGRLTVDGHVFGKTTLYRLDLGMNESGTFTFVKDLWVQQQLSSAPVWLRAGIWKRPYNRQEIVSDFASEFNERAITATFVGGGRDYGLALHNDYERSPAPIEWVVGIFNTFFGGRDLPVIKNCVTDPVTGLTSCPPPTGVPVDFEPALVARVGWNSPGIKGYSEADLEGGPLRYAIGLSYKIGLGNLAKQGQDSIADNLSHGVDLDAMFKFYGTFIEVGGYLLQQPASRASNRSAEVQLAAFGQVGYFFIPKHFELAGRVAFAPDPVTEERDQFEARLAINWYWHGHAWKWASDVGVLLTTGEDPTTMEDDEPVFVLRSMLQLTL